MLKTLSVFAQPVIKADTSNFMTLRIDPSNANGGNVSDVFEKVNYIPLETTPESLFGSIEQLEIVDNYYIILDQNTNCILIFTKAGKFHAKIKGRPANERKTIRRFIVNKWTKQIIYSGDSFASLTYCNYDGKVIRNVSYKADLGQNELRSDDFYFLGPDRMVSNGYYSDFDTTDVKYYRPYMRSLLMFADSARNITGRALTYTSKQGFIDVISSGHGPLSSLGNDTTVLYSKPYEQSLYMITPHTLKLSYKFIFPLFSSLPNDFITNPIYNKKHVTYIESHRDAIFSLNNCFKTGNNLLFEASVYGVNKEDNLIYNLRSGNLVAFKHISPDERSYFLPMYDQVSYVFENSGLSGTDGEYVYTGISSIAMFKAYEENLDKKTKYNPQLTEYFKKGTRKDNPVILQFKVKDDL